MTDKPRRRRKNPDYREALIRCPQLHDVAYLQRVFRPGVTLAAASAVIRCSQPLLSVALRHHGFVRHWVKVGGQEQDRAAD